MPTADPIEAAKSLAGQTYATANERTAAGKTALLNQLSTQGTYNNALDAQSTAAAAPTGPAQPANAPTSNLGQQAVEALAQHGAQQIQATNQASLQAAAALAAQQRDQQQAASGTYFDQTAAALPIEQSRAQSDAAQIMQQLIAQREQIAAEKEMQQLQIQQQREAIAAAREARAAAAAQTKSGKTLDYADKASIRDDAFAAAASGIQLRKGDGTPTARALALEWLTADPSHTVDEAFKKFGITTARSRQEVVDAMNTFARVAGANEYYGANPIPTYSYAAPTGAAQFAGAKASASGKAVAKPKAPASRFAGSSAKGSGSSGVDKSLKPKYDSMGHIVGYYK